jgi:putative DNA primase/helicase
VSEERKPRRVELRIVEPDEIGPPGGPPGGGGDGGGEEAVRPFWGSEQYLAQELSADLGEDWLCAMPGEEWRHWDGVRWRRDVSLLVYARSTAVCRRVAKRADNAKLARQIESKATAYAVAKLAGIDRRHAILADLFDADPWRLNTPGGILDLKTGQLLPPDRTALFTQLAGAIPEGECPRWRKFLREATGGDDELERYLQRVSGYLLTGRIDEHVIFFLYGKSRTGKTVFLSLMLAMLADYGMTAPMDMFTVTMGERHPTELADLAGRRLVVASETQEGKRWDEAKLKSISGGDRIRAHKMRQDSFEFAPQFKLLLAGNHRPRMRSGDDAMRARFHVVPFQHRQPVLDKQLPDKLRVELGGILRWAVAGELERQRLGLAPPRAVREATDDYFETEDVIGRWIDERCESGPNAVALTRELYRDFRAWAIQVNERVPSERGFAQQLQRLDGVERWRHPQTRAMGFRGVAPKGGQAELPLGAGAGRAAVLDDGMARGDPADWSGG